MLSCLFSFMCSRYHLFEEVLQNILIFGFRFFSCNLEIVSKLLEMKIGSELCIKTGLKYEVFVLYLFIVLDKKPATYQRVRKMLLML